MLEILAAAASPGQIAFLIGVSFLAGLARGFSGFGAALIFVPLANIAVGPKVAVPLLLVMDGVMTLGLIPNAVRQADRPSVLLMALGAIFGVPLGVYLLAQLDAELLRWSIAILVLLMLGLLMSGLRYHGRPRAPLTTSVGFVSGLLSGLAQIGGPPVVGYWLGGAIPAASVRANFIAYFAISTVVSAISYVVGGLITGSVLVLALVTAPLFGLGVWLGSRMFGLASEQTFRNVCYLLVAAAAILGMPILDGILK